MRYTLAERLTRRVADAFEPVDFRKEALLLRETVAGGDWRGVQRVERQESLWSSY